MTTLLRLSVIGLVLVAQAMPINAEPSVYLTGVTIYNPAKAYIRHRRAGQAMYPPHQGAHIPLNMTAILRSAGWAILQANSIALATTLEGYAMKPGSVVQVQ